MAFTNIIPEASQALQQASDFVTGFNTAIITPILANGISGFEFDIPSGETLSLEADVTDHYTENNTFVNDHIVNKPVRFTTRGFVGELVYRVPQGISGVVSDLQAKLSELSGYLGSRTPGFVQSLQSVVTQTDRAISQIDTTIQKAQNVVEFLASPFNSGLTKQMVAFKKIQALIQNKTIVTVLTPWEFYPAMVIVSATCEQGDTTDQITDFSISLKEFRASNIKFTSFNNDIFVQPNQIQGAPEIDQGPLQGKEELASTLYKNKNAINQLLGGQ